MSTSESFKRIYPLQYWEKFIQQGIRPDGRLLGSVRNISITSSCVSAADGSSVVKIGKTTVICGIKYAVTSPLELSPRNGKLDISVVVSPLSSDVNSVSYTQSASMMNSTANQALVLSEFLKYAVESTGLINYEDLCIQEGHSVWLLQADLIILDDDGNTMDCALLALVSALKDFHLPDKVVVGEDGKVKQIGFEKDKKLQLHHSIVSLTFGIYHDYLVVDPTAEEEQGVFSLYTGGGGGQITILCDENSNVLLYRQGGIPALMYKQIQQCCTRTREHFLMLNNTGNKNSTTTSTTISGNNMKLSS